ncbi:MAG: hypothetical protein IJU95_05840 [Treponema sp.]|nr:hypothetical protein [Treponema sp.]
MQARPAQKLISRILLALMPLFLIWLFFALCPPLSYVDQDTADSIWTRNFADTHHETPYNVIILGDSLANCAYIPNFLNGSSANLSVMGSSPVHEYYIIRRYLKNNPPPKTCYISFSDGLIRSLASHFPSIGSTKILSLPESMEINKECGRFGTKFKAVPDCPIWEFYLFSPRIYQLSVIRGLFSNRKESNKHRIRHSDIHAGAYMQPVSVAFGTTDVTQDAFSIAPLNDNYYRKIIELCLSYGIQVKIVKLPSHPSLIFTENYKRDFAEYYSNLKADYPGITVDWFEYGLADDCFVDNMGHMNLKGGCMFCKMLARYYPEDFAQSVPMQEDMLAGLEEYRQMGFDPSQAEPDGTLQDIFVPISKNLRQ